MVMFHDRRDGGGSYEVTATDPHGSKYHVHGADSKEAGRSVAFHMATGMIPRDAQVHGGRAVRYPPDRG